MRIGFDRPEIVDGDDLDVFPARLGGGAKDKATDPPKPVDSNPNSHALLLVCAQKAARFLNLIKVNWKTCDKVEAHFGDSFTVG
jgi:hypothetical protein